MGQGRRYRIHSRKRRGAYFIFHTSNLTLTQGRRLFETWTRQRRRTVAAARFLWWSEAAPCRPWKWGVTYRISFVPYFGGVWTPIRPLSEINKWERGLDPVETENNIKEWELEFSAPREGRGTLGSRDFSSAVSGFRQVLIVTRAKTENSRRTREKPLVPSVRTRRTRRRRRRRRRSVPFRHKERLWSRLPRAVAVHTIPKSRNP